MSQECFLLWDIAAVHTMHSTTSVVEFLASKGVKLILSHPICLTSPPVDFFLFSRVKSELAGLTLFQENYRNSWEGVARIITNEEFAAASSLPAAEGAL